ncbi:MAG TPA: DMT family transporter [Thermoplasmata archaeon]|nr:DMT family transporter [Thermoplasmata archaeon]
MAEKPSILGAGLPQLLLLGVLWGATFPVARVAVAAGADPFLLVVLDLLLAAAVLAPVAAASRSPRPVALELARSAGLGALLIAGINVPLYWGLQHATGGSASIVYATSPILSLLALYAAGSPVVLHRRQLLALTLGLGGVVLLGLQTSGASASTNLAVLAAFALGASCQGAGAVLVGRARPEGEGHWGLTFQFLGGAGAAAVTLPFLASSAPFPVTLSTVGSVVYVGVVSMAVGYTLFFDLIHRAGAVRANQVTFLNPVVALTVGVVAFGESWQPLEGVALACIIGALVLLQTVPGHRGATSAPRSDAPRRSPTGSVPAAGVPPSGLPGPGAGQGTYVSHDS